jgi:hypothetical protein
LQGRIKKRSKGKEKKKKKRRGEVAEQGFFFCYPQQTQITNPTSSIKHQAQNPPNPSNDSHPQNSDQ